MLIAQHNWGMMTAPKPPQIKQVIDRDAFRYRLAYILEKTGQTKTNFASSIGISKSNFTQVLKGTRMLTVDQLYAIFMVYGVPMEYLLAGQETDLPERFRR